MDEADLEVGGVYSLRAPDSTYYVAKILGDDEVGYYVRSFGNVFDQRPTIDDLPSLSMDRIDSSPRRRCQGGLAAP